MARGAGLGLVETKETFGIGGMGIVARSAGHALDVGVIDRPLALRDSLVMTSHAEVRVIGLEDEALGKPVALVARLALFFLHRFMDVVLGGVRVLFLLMAIGAGPAGGGDPGGGIEQEPRRRGEADKNEKEGE